MLKEIINNGSVTRRVPAGQAALGAHALYLALAVQGSDETVPISPSLIEHVDIKKIYQRKLQDLSFTHQKCLEIEYFPQVREQRLSEAMKQECYGNVGKVLLSTPFQAWCGVKFQEKLHLCVCFYMLRWTGEKVARHFS